MNNHAHHPIQAKKRTLKWRKKNATKPINCTACGIAILYMRGAPRRLNSNIFRESLSINTVFIVMRFKRGCWSLMLKCNDEHKTNRILEFSHIFCYFEMVNGRTCTYIVVFFYFNLPLSVFFSQSFPNRTFWTCGMWTNYESHDIVLIARHQSEHVFRFLSNFCDIISIFGER